MIVLAHRGLVDGPDRAAENRLETVENALSMGFGLETDIRFLDQIPYISHDRAQGSIDPSRMAEKHAPLWSASTRPIALNFKESGTESLLLDFLVRARVDRRVCVFDMELVEATPGETATRMGALHPGLAMASRASDRGEPLRRALDLPGRVVWMDEFDRPWIRREDVDAVHDHGKQAWMVLPDLHGSGKERALERLAAFERWGVDAVCTDWAIEARRFLERST